MVGMRIGRMRVGVLVMVMMPLAVMVVVVLMVVIVVMMILERGERQAMFLAEGFVAAGGVAVAVAGAVFQSTADALDMVVVALLGRADIGLEAEHRLAVFAQGAIHGVVAGDKLAQAIDKGFDHQLMVVEIGRLDEIDLRMSRCSLVDRGIDAFDQDTGEQKIGENNDTLEPEPDRPVERRSDKREGDAGIGGLAPPVAHAFPQHAHHLGDIGIGIRVRSTAPHHHQQRLMARNALLCSRLGLGDAGAGGIEHLEIDAEFGPISDLDAMLCGIGVEHGRDVVLGVAGGEQHARQREHALDACVPQLVETKIDHRVGEFEIAVFDRNAFKALAEDIGQMGEFVDGATVAAAVTAQHDAGTLRQGKIDSHIHLLVERALGKAGCFGSRRSKFESEAEFRSKTNAQLRP